MTARMILTQQTAPSALPGKIITSGKADAPGQAGLFAAMPGLEFFDLIMANHQIAVQEDAAEDRKDTAQHDEAGNNALLGLLLQHLDLAQGSLKDKEIESGDDLPPGLQTVLEKIQAAADAGNPLAATLQDADGTIDLSTLLTLASDTIATQTQNEAKSPAAALKTLLADLLTTGSGAERTGNESEESVAAGAPLGGGKKFVDMLQSLLNGIPEENRPLIFKLPPGLLSKAIDMDNLALPGDKDAPTGDAEIVADALLASESTGAETEIVTEPEAGDGETATTSPSLIATGLSPEQLTAMIETLQTGGDSDQALVVGIVKILPPQAKKEIIFLPRALILPKPEAAPSPTPIAEASVETIPAGETVAAPETQDTSTAPAPEAANDTPDSLGSLLALLRPHTKIPAPAEKPAPEKSEGLVIHNNHKRQNNNVEILAKLNNLLSDANTTSGDSADAPDGTKEYFGFERLLRVLEDAQQPETQTRQTPGLERVADVLRHLSAALSTIRQRTPIEDGMGLKSLMDTASLNSLFPEGLNWMSGANGHNIQMSLTGPASFTSLVNHAQQAVLPHPATQIVAVSIAKAAGQGETKTLTLKLEPPELGRVDIQMNFGKDSKELKVHLMIEKPETYMMMQRDSHVLMRALLDAGLDAGGTNLSFELAQNGNMSGQNDGNGQRNYSGSDSSESGAAAGEIVETHMDWYVDPKTGLTHYNALV